MSYVDKLVQATKFIEEHNAEVESQEDKVSVEAFVKKLKKIGGTTESAIKESSFEDLESAGLPRIIARKVAAIFRSDAPKTKLGDGDFVTEKKAGRMAPLYLLQQYNFGENDTPVAKRLLEVSKGEPFLVIDGGSIDIEESHKLLLEIYQKGLKGREVVLIDGRPVRPVRIGDKKKEMVDENPIYAGRPLRPDGTCDQLNRSWAGVSLAVKQIIYLAINDTKEINVSHAVAHDLLDRALLTTTSLPLGSPMSDAEKIFRQRYPKASIRLDELTEEGNAPSLQIPLSATISSKKNDPFHKTF